MFRLHSLTQVVFSRYVCAWISQDAWAKELQVTQKELQDQLSTAHQKLQSQAEQNSELVSELEALRKESAGLRMALQGQVFTNDSNGLMVHEQEEDDDGVLLSVTPVDDAKNGWPFSKSVAPSRGAVQAPPSGLDTHQNGYSLPSGFVGASINSGFEIFHSYFDASGVNKTAVREAHFVAAASASRSS